QHQRRRNLQHGWQQYERQFQSRLRHERRSRSEPEHCHQPVGEFCLLSLSIIAPMKPYLPSLPTLLVIGHWSLVISQGPLTPPGAPAPTMKTLDQIEARTPISSAPFTITNSGSYYLTTNLSVSTGNAITIATNGVTLDLNGFTISSTAAS